MNTIVQSLPELLLPWFAQNRRDLPWRHTRDPYAIWISEIMLQQTRVEAVKGYYARFLSALPTISALAQADDGFLRKLWEGLGYYTRVQNLKKAAIVLVQEYGGAFPRDYHQILALPGIGEYTAGAICSIAFDQPTPAVDGNVLRVMARLLADSRPIQLPALKREVRQLLSAVYPPHACGAFTQALMELGATVCLPNGQPHCDVCPMVGLCRAYNTQTVSAYPVTAPKRPKKEVELTVFLLDYDGKIAVQQRENRGLLAGLWEFPNVPGHLPEQQALNLLADAQLSPRQLLCQVQRDHVFTHVIWHMRAYRIACGAPGALPWMEPERIQAEIPLPTAFRQFWEFFSD